MTYFKSRNNSYCNPDAVLDLFFKNALSATNEWQSLNSNFKMQYPSDVWFNDEFYVLEFAMIDGNIDDVEITKTADELRIKYNPNRDETNDKTYLYRGIVRRAFDQVWKVSAKLDLSAMQATYENGKLSIYLPWAKSAIPEKVEVLNINKNWKELGETGKLTEKSN